MDGQLELAECMIWATLETGCGNSSHETMKAVDSSTVRMRKYYWKLC